ncbi:MAG: PTS system mannose/fructose/sorbose family transporter subunit IID, partial [Granulicatella sp.]
MSEKKITLSKKDRRSVMLRSQFLQGSWNYERMQNGGWAFALIPALKKLYPNKEDATQNEGWFYEGAGIYRHVWLNSYSPVHSSPEEVFIYTK